MSKLTTAVISTASADAVKGAILDVFQDFDERVQSILAEKVLGIFELPEIPATSNIAKDAIFTKYNLLDDKVFYTCTRIDTRYFKDELDANLWANGQSSYSGSYTQDSEFAIKATKERQEESSCALYRWLQK
jgi:hypothetical protein